MIDIGLFSEDLENPTAEDHIIYLQKHRLSSGENIIELEVERLPLIAGVDPLIKMADRNSDDNLKNVDTVSE